MANNINPDELHDGILNRLLNAVPNDVDKREGSIIFNALEPVALELQQIYQELNDVITNTFADTADLDHLILRAKERGVEWLAATNAIILASLTFNAEEVLEEPEVIGSIFAVENSTLMYEVIEKVSYAGNVGVYKLKCQETGLSGNIASGDLLIEEAEDDALIDNLEIATILGIDTSARNDEELEDFRKRYFDSIDTDAFGGNVADYKEKAQLQPAIGAIKVIPVWNGGGTVKLIFLNAIHGIPTENEIAEVQNTFDPTPQGTGYGLAPIGHTVTVVGATSQEMNIVAAGTYEEGYDFETLKEPIRGVCEDYFLSLRKDWADSQTLTISPGVLAYEIKRGVEHIETFSCSINGESADFILDNMEAPILGTLSEAEEE